ncbi:PREDICTED: uncharacterized protein LOC104574417, partial [Tinamus guttatus]|uniref:uncharacterized protein LOC104574417 n=1 Tax=Tinamus guttatus TaxID=94827 RepID=UPI00052F0D2A
DVFLSLAWNMLLCHYACKQRPEAEGDRGGAVGRAHAGSKPKAELKLSRSLSKSDSDLLTCSPTEDDAMGSRSESLSNCSTGKKRLEKSPSFASEWDEIEKIMSSIGEGIDFSQEQQRISAPQPPFPLMQVLLKPGNLNSVSLQISPQKQNRICQRTKGKKTPPPPEPLPALEQGKEGQTGSERDRMLRGADAAFLPVTAALALASPARAARSDAAFPERRKGPVPVGCYSVSLAPLLLVTR